MKLENLLKIPIQSLKTVELTPTIMLASVFSIILILVLFYWSGLSEKMENLSFGKKIIVFLLVTFLIFIVYYIFYKAGKFDRILDYLDSSGIYESIAGKIKIWMGEK